MAKQLLQSPLTSIDILKGHTTSVVGVKREYAQVNETVLTCGNDATFGNFNSKKPGFLPGQRKQLTASKIHDPVVHQNDRAETPIPLKRMPLMSTPDSSLNPLLSLSHSLYAIPPELVKNFAFLGITNIYPWQSSCLLGRGLLAGEKNLIYTAPTGGGKSLVADVLMLKRVVQSSSKKAILVLPYVALVQEKVNWLRKAVAGVHKDEELSSQHQSFTFKRRLDRSVRVVGFFGSSKTRASWTDIDIAVCTFEKANLLINSAIEQRTIGDLGVVVLDELHMIDDDHRGYLMELLATKLLSLERRVQIIGMSATLPNIQVLAKWLDAKYYESKHQPIPIQEYLVFDNSIYPTSTSSAFFRNASQVYDAESSTPLHPARTICTSTHNEFRNPVTNAVVALAVETANDGYGALVFCSSRPSSETTALVISEAMLNGNDETQDQRKDLVDELRSLPVGLDQRLEKTIMRGVAFHHAGMTAEERETIANAYDRKIILVLVATCSLAAGINLPTRRVILQGTRMGKDPLGPAMLRQMRGRAGRKGKDEVGESYLVCSKSELGEAIQLLEADLPKVQSSMTPARRGIKRALLEVITVQLATHIGSIEDYVSRTLLYHTIDKEQLKNWVETNIQELLDSGQITMDAFGSYEATPLSQATVGSCMTPEDGVFVYEELRRALRAFVMDGEMHIFYTFTPINIWGLGEINWPIFRREMDRLDESGLRVLEFVGINPAFVNKMANSGKRLPEEDPEKKNSARLYRRFYAAFQLRDLCNEVPIHEVAQKYKIPRGSVQALAQTCEGFAVGMINFCEKLGWGMLKSVLEHMSDRLKAGARADLLELARIPFVKSRTARIFWENGLRGLRAVADVDAEDLIPLLLLAQPKRYWADKADETRYQHKMLLRARVIVDAANRLWGILNSLKPQGSRPR